jgi:RNA polymerase sigma-70 factor (ECF subfamily)
MSAVHVWNDTPKAYRRFNGRRRPERTLVRDEAPAPDPNDLIVRIAARADRAAFAELFQHFAPRVKGYAMRLGAAGPAAEELAQETLLAVWRKAAQFDPAKASAATWIFTIARNLRIDAIRRERPLPLEAEEPAAEPLADALIAAAERDGRVREALRSLSPEQIEVIELSFFSEAPHSVIAERLGLPLGTVKSRLRLAMARLRALLEDVR